MTPSPAALAALTKLLKEAYYSKGTREAHLDAEWLMVQPEWATVVSASSAIPGPTPEPKGPWKLRAWQYGLEVVNGDPNDPIDGSSVTSYAFDSEAEAIAVRDALNRVAGDGGAPHPEPKGDSQ